MQTLILLTIISLPLYVIRFKIFGLPTTALEVLIVTTVIYWLYNHWKSPRGLRGAVGAFKNPLSAAAVIFLVVSLVSVFLSSDKIAALGIYRAYFLEPWLLFTIILDSYYLKEGKILKALVFSGYLVAFFAILQFFTHQPYFSDAIHELEVGRVSSFYNSANAVALYLGPIVTLLLGNWVKTKKISSFQLFSLAIFLFTILIAHSAGSLIGLLAVLFFYLVYFLLGRQPKVQNQLFRLFPLAIGALLVIFVIFLFNISLLTPKTGLVYPRPFDNTRVIRLCLWEGTRDLLKDNYLLGTGLNNFREKYTAYRTCDTERFQYPHNIFLTFWTETGILGLISFLSLVWVFYSKILKNHLPNGVKLGLTGFLIYFFIHGMVDVPYFKNDLSTQFWVFLAFGLILIKKFDVTER